MTDYHDPRIHASFYRAENVEEDECPVSHVTTAQALASVPERVGREGDSQPLPTRNSAPDVQSQVIADIEARRALGIRRYGTALQPHNGRNALQDLYEELLDAAMYVKQRLIEDEDEPTAGDVLRAADVIRRAGYHLPASMFPAVNNV